jgi:hypothetical protein
MESLDLDSSLLLPIFHFSLSTASFLVSIQLSNRARRISAPLVYGFAVLSLHTSPRLSWIYQGAASYWNLMIWVWMHHATTVFFVETFQFPCVPMSKEGWILAYKIWADPRHQVNWSTYMQTREQRVIKSRSYLFFALRRIAKIALCWYLELRIINPAIASHFQFRAEDFAPRYEPLIRRTYYDTTMDFREFQIRTVISVYWIWLAYLLLDGANVLLSIFFVSILRFDRPEEWMPLFGSVVHTSSIRGFWGKFWHGLAAPSCASSGRFLTRSTLRVRSRSAGEKIFIVFWTFFVSAVIHAAAEWQADEPVFLWRQLQFWLTNFFAAALETLIIGIWNQIAKYLGLCSNRAAKLCFKVIGHLWVFVFFLWIVPGWQYPKLFVALTPPQAAEIRDGSNAFLELLLSG